MTTITDLDDFETGGSDGTPFTLLVVVGGTGTLVAIGPVSAHETLGAGNRTEAAAAPANSGCSPNSG